MECWEEARGSMFMARLKCIILSTIYTSGTSSSKANRVYFKCFSKTFSPTATSPTANFPNTNYPSHKNPQHQFPHAVKFLISPTATSLYNGWCYTFWMFPFLHTVPEWFRFFPWHWLYVVLILIGIQQNISLLRGQCINCQHCRL